jgi:hypothetical protein
MTTGRLPRWAYLALNAVALQLGVVAPVLGEEGGPAAAGQTLYNGIRLPAIWPPRDRPVSREPMPVPYLESPPAVIPIDVGRQLFVDDFLIEQTTLKRTYYTATYHPASPVLKPDKPWEQEGASPTAMVFSDGVWYDPQDRLFKMWYMGGYVKYTCYATSKDGIHWHKPSLDVRPGTNIVHTSARDSVTVWLDLADKDPQRRYKMFMYLHPGGGGVYSIFFSADGIHWGDCVARSGPTGDRATVFYNPFRKVWVYSIRDYDPKSIGRFRRYSENPDVLAAARWEDRKAPFWVGADKLDPQRPDLKTPVELYNLDCVAYESLMIGLFSIWYGQPKDRAKPNELCIGFSRDGFHWQRPVHKPNFLGVSERYGDYNWANIQSAGGCCLVVGDQLYFYVSTRAGRRGSSSSGVGTTSMGTLRRDGFASMDAGEDPGTLTTRQLRFGGKHLFVNADTHEGELRAEVLDADGRVVAPFTRENCEPIRADKTLLPVRWKGATDLSARAGKPIKFRFHVTKGRLYAFWISPEPTGASHGYVAAGGPGYTGATDTVGSAPSE